MGTDEAWEGVLLTGGWSGPLEQPVIIIGETPKRYRIRACQRTRLPGRSGVPVCWLYTGETALVPKYAVRISTIASSVVPS